MYACINVYTHTLNLNISVDIKVKEIKAIKKYYSSIILFILISKIPSIISE